MSLTVEQLRELSKKITEDPAEIYNLEADESAQLRKYLHPLGNIVSAKKCYVNMGLVNWKDKYLRRLHTTALIGYTYRLLEEYEPQEVEAENAKYAAAFAQAVTTQEKAELSSQHAAKCKLLTTTARGIIRQFLNRNFEFDPDHHIRSAHTDNPGDPERRPLAAVVTEAAEKASKSKNIDEKLQSRPEATYQYLRSKLLTVYQTTQEVTALLKSVLSVILSPDTDLSDKQGILMKKYKLLLDIGSDMKKIADPLAAADTISALTVDPPVNLFHQFDRYLTNHYEQLTEIVKTLYDEKSDFEFAVVLYDAFKTPEAAREYRVQHESEFRTDVFTVESSAVTLIGPFKENRNRVDFYNKNTEVMKRMMEQLESDHKLGSDLMSKQVKTQKKKNIAEAGPDAPGLAAYSKAMNVVAELGAKKVLSKEELNEMEAARTEAGKIKEDYEVPDDAIQIDVFFPKVAADGTTAISKTKFYSQAEAPTFMQDPEMRNEPYQPLRGDSESLDTAYRTKVITSRTGEKKEIRVPRGESA